MTMFVLIEPCEFTKLGEPTETAERRVFEPGTIFNGLWTDTNLNVGEEYIQLCTLPDASYGCFIMMAKIAAPCAGPLDALALMACDDLCQAARERRLLLRRDRAHLSTRNARRDRKTRPARTRKKGKGAACTELQPRKPAP